MAISCFEGFEKRLELRFFGDDPLGLRGLSISTITQVLSEVQCTIVSGVGNRFFDSYVLSESSLFVYPFKVIIKTCGTTQLLKSIPSLLPHASFLGLRLVSCRYSRGSFIFPESQPYPHTNFRDEIDYLEENLPSDLFRRKACILPSDGLHSWHVYSAAANMNTYMTKGYTVEVCMTGLHRTLANRFYRNKSDYALSCDELGRKMTDMSGIDSINPRSVICGYGFDPCGYSMNGLDGDCYSTIHVTPEDGYSYASFECVGDSWSDITDGLAKVIRVFGPKKASVSVCGAQLGAEKEVLAAVMKAVETNGFKCEGAAVESFPGVESVTYQTFSAKPPGKKVISSRECSSFGNVPFSSRESVSTIDIL